MARVTRSSAKAAASGKSVEKPIKAAPAITKKKVTKKAAVKPQKETRTDETAKIVSIEACKSWGAFRSRAKKILDAVGSKATVEVNKEKPGKGDFIVTVSGVEEPIVELKALKRPFPALKALDMNEVVQNVIKALGEEE